jgi:hypothetical protein
MIACQCLSTPGPLWDSSGDPHEENNVVMEQPWSAPDNALAFTCGARSALSGATPRYGRASVHSPLIGNI